MKTKERVLMSSSPFSRRVSQCKQRNCLWSTRQQSSLMWTALYFCVFILVSVQSLQSYVGVSFPEVHTVRLQGLPSYSVYRHCLLANNRNCAPNKAFHRRYSRLHSTSPSEDPSENTNQQQTSGNDESNTTTLTDRITSFFSHISWKSLLSGVLIGSIFTISIPSYILSQMSSNDESYTVIGKNIVEPVTLFQNILMDLEFKYVDKIDSQKLFKTGIDAMLKSLDPYTEFEDLKAAKLMQESVSGKYGGVGLVISNNVKNGVGKDKNGLTPGFNGGGGVVVSAAFEGYAYDMGLRPGDHILRIDDVDVTNMNVKQVRNLLRGDPDTAVHITYSREQYVDPKIASFEAKQKSPLNTASSSKNIVQEVTLQRYLVKISDIKLATLLGNPEEGIGYINVNGFNGGVAKDFRDAFNILRYSAPNDLKTLILDLRGNPGGLLDQAVEIASYLVPPDSVLVSSKGRNSEEVVYKSGEGLNAILQKQMKTQLGYNDQQMFNSLSSSSASSFSSSTGDSVLEVDASSPSTVSSNNNEASNTNQKQPNKDENSPKQTIISTMTTSIRPSNMKLIVLINQNSASASEILAGAIQDLDAGVIIGPSHTYGKGLVQKIVPLPFDNALKFTIAKYYTPSGRCIQKIRYEGGRTPTSQGISEDGKSTEERDASTGVFGGDLQNVGDDDDFEMKEDLNEDQDNDINTSIVPETQRQFFQTLRQGRLVRDGGGIEPDILIPPIKVSPIEGYLFTKNTFTDYINVYLRTHEIRHEIQQAAQREKAQRDFSPFYANIAKYTKNTASSPYATALGQFFVSNHDVQSESIVSNIDPIDRLLEEVTSEQRSKQSENSKLKQMPTIGINSEVAQSYFWNDAFQTKGRSNVLGGLNEDELFTGFVSYVQDKLISPLEQSTENGISLQDMYRTELTSLQKVFQTLQLPSTLEKQVVEEKVIPYLKNKIVQDLQSNKQFIVDNLECALLEKEFSSRNIVYHTVIQDPQVHVAMTLAQKTTPSDSFVVKKIPVELNTVTHGKVDVVRCEVATKDVTSSSSTPHSPAKPTSSVGGTGEEVKMSLSYEDILQASFCKP